MNTSAAPLALGIDLGGTKIHAALLWPDGRIHWQQRVATPAGDYAQTLAALAKLVAAASSTAAIAEQSITVGVGGPGSLTAQGVIQNANSTCLNGRRLVDDLQSAIGLPVRYANDANCLALSEAVDGAGAGLSVVFAVILGTGTGAGIAVNGQVLSGPNRLSGEWGHNPLPWMSAQEQAAAEREACWCGQRGCVEFFLCGPGISRDHAQHGGASISAADIAHRAHAGDAACSASLERHTERLARALANVINLLDPDVIVLAGGLSLMPHLVADVPRLWGPWVFQGDHAEPIRTQLKVAVHGDASGVRGAAWLWRDPRVASGLAPLAG